MSSQLIDLSHSFRADMTVAPGTPAFSCCPIMTIEKDGGNMQVLTMGSHTGTHIDAPYHFFADGRTIDDIPLSMLVGPALVIDLTANGAKNKIDWDQLAPYEDEMRAVGEKGGILVLHTGWSKYWRTEMYFDHPFLTRYAAEKIVDTGVRVIGIDALSPDETLRDALPEFAAHRAVLGAGGVIAENLTNLEAIQEGEWTVSLVPLKIEGSDGSPIRAFACIR